MSEQEKKDHQKVVDFSCTYVKGGLLITGRATVYQTTFKFSSPFQKKFSIPFSEIAEVTTHVTAGLVDNGLTIVKTNGEKIRLISVYHRNKIYAYFIGIQKGFDFASMTQEEKSTKVREIKRKLKDHIEIPVMHNEKVPQRSPENTDVEQSESANGSEMGLSSSQAIRRRSLSVATSLSENCFQSDTCKSVACGDISTTTFSFNDDANFPKSKSDAKSLCRSDSLRGTPGVNIPEAENEELPTKTKQIICEKINVPAEEYCQKVFLNKTYWVNYLSESGYADIKLEDWELKDGQLRRTLDANTEFSNPLVGRKTIRAAQHHSLCKHGNSFYISLIVKTIGFSLTEALTLYLTIKCASTGATSCVVTVDIGTTFSKTTMLKSIIEKQATTESTSFYSDFVEKSKGLFTPKQVETKAPKTPRLSSKKTHQAPTQPKSKHGIKQMQSLENAVNTVMKFIRFFAIIVTGGYFLLMENVIFKATFLVVMATFLLCTFIFKPKFYNSEDDDPKQVDLLEKI